MENDRRKYINIGGKVIQVLNILQYANSHQIKAKEISINELKKHDVLPHFCKFAQFINDEIFFKDFSFEKFADEIKYLNNRKFDNVFPIIMLNDGTILDGAHRILYALLNNIEKLNAIILTQKDLNSIIEECK
jgi:hypothetical protein